MTTTPLSSSRRPFEPSTDESNGRSLAPSTSRKSLMLGATYYEDYRFFSCTVASIVSVRPDAETEKARAAHEHRLAWQKAHPKEYALQQDQLGAEAAKRAYAAEHTPCKNFGRGIEAIPDISSVVASYTCQSVGGGVLIHLTVRDSAWSSADYDERLQLAKGMWGACVRLVRPEHADSCHVRLVGEAGEELGGSNAFVGSMIDVSKD